MHEQHEQKQSEFLGKRMIALREKNNKSQSEMAISLFVDKSTLSKVENGKASYRKTKEFAEKYCDILGLTDVQKQHFMRGAKAVVADTSALLKRIRLIEDLSIEYNPVIVPGIVINELDNIKDKNKNGLASKAWQILMSISANDNIITRDYTGDDHDAKNDVKIIDIAKKASEEFNCPVDIITYDTGYAARLSGTDTVVRALFLEEYIATKQNLPDADTLKKIDG